MMCAGRRWDVVARSPDLATWPTAGLRDSAEAGDLRSGRRRGRETRANEIATRAGSGDPRRTEKCRDFGGSGRPAVRQTAGSGDPRRTGDPSRTERRGRETQAERQAGKPDLQARRRSGSGPKSRSSYAGADDAAQGVARQALGNRGGEDVPTRGVARERRQDDPVGTGQETRCIDPRDPDHRVRCPEIVRSPARG